MKTVKVNNKMFKLKNNIIASALCGAYCAGHIAVMGHATEDHCADFAFLFSRNIKRMKNVVKELPSDISLKDLLTISPANVWTDMME